MENNKQYIAPDYSEIPPDELEHPRDDEPVEFDKDLTGEDDFNDDEEMQDENKLDEYVTYEEEQRRLNENLVEQNYNNNNIMSTPFGNTVWGQGTSGGNNNNSAPWEQNTPWGQSNNISNNQNNGGTNYPWESQQQNNTTSSYWQTSSSQNKQEEKKVFIPRPKQVVICDVMDCLIEPIGSNGRPNMQPRGIWDITLKFDVWDKIATFNPQQIFAMFPILGGNQDKDWDIALGYISTCLSEYLRIPTYNCQIVKLTQIGRPKNLDLQFVIQQLKNKRDAVYIGVHSGLYGLSSTDIMAAKYCDIPYVDLWQLLKEKI